MGAASDGSSRVPARSMVIPGIACGRPNNVVPHFEQKVRSMSLPLSPGLLNVLTGPVILTEASGTPTMVE